MKKITIIVALLLTSITSNQMNCMDAWTDPYGLMDENQTSSHASIGINTDNTHKFNVFIGVYIFHEGNILLTELEDVNNQKYWNIPTMKAIPGKETQVSIKEYIQDRTGLDLYDLKVYPGFVEKPLNHYFLLKFSALAPTDKLTDNRFKWFNKRNIPHNLAEEIDKNIVYKNL